MASGCIMGTCLICKEYIYEDELDVVGDNDNFIHNRCKGEYIKQKYHISEEQFQRLYEAQVLRRDMELMDKDIRDTLGYYRIKCRELWDRLNEIENNKEAITWNVF